MQGNEFSLVDIYFYAAFCMYCMYVCTRIFFYKQHFYKQHQAEMCQKISKT